MFARHGYVFLYRFRRGNGPSADQGANSGDVLEQERAAHGQEAHARLLLRLLEGEELSDTLAALAVLRARPEVDARRVGIVGASFGGMLALLVAERDRGVRAAVEFAGAAHSWSRSPEMRARLRAAVAGSAAPIFFIQAANDYSVAPAEELAAEMARRHRPHRVKIYPAVGRTAEDGHHFVQLGLAAWEPDVFAFLDENL